MKQTNFAPKKCFVYFSHCCFSTQPTINVGLIATPYCEFRVNHRDEFWISPLHWRCPKLEHLQIRRWIVCFVNLPPPPGDQINFWPFSALYSNLHLNKSNYWVVALFCKHTERGEQQNELCKPDICHVYLCESNYLYRFYQNGILMRSGRLWNCLRIGSKHSFKNPSIDFVSLADPTCLPIKLFNPF